MSDRRGMDMDGGTAREMAERLWLRDESAPNRQQPERRKARNLARLRAVGARWHRLGRFTDPRDDVRDAAEVMAGGAR